MVSIRVFLVDDHDMVREGLRALLEKEKDIQVVGEAREGEEAARKLAEISPVDIVIMDVVMDRGDGVKATRQILADNPSVKILALSMHAEPWYVGEMLRAGASGYVLKENSYDELARALRALTRNQNFLSPSITKFVVKKYLGEEVAGGSSHTAVLTGRQYQVLQLMARGLSTRDIAAALLLSAKTIETHRKHIMAKLGAYTTADLVKYALRMGLVALDECGG